MGDLLISNTLAATDITTGILAGNRKQGISPAETGVQQNVYAVGTLQARFPSLSVEKEFFQALPSPSTGGSTSDGGISFDVSDEVGLLQLNLSQNLTGNLYTVLSQAENFYIAREMCWSLTNTDGNEIYSIIPASNQRLNELIGAIKPDTNGNLQNYIITGGMKAGFVNPSCMNGDAPVVMLVNLLPASTEQIVSKVTQQDNSVNATYLQGLVDEILSLNANDGMTDHDRALNYVLYNNMDIYLRSYQHLYNSNNNGPNPSGYQLVNIRTEWGGSTARKIVRIILDYQGIDSGATQSWYSSVDVTGQFPFLLTGYSRYLQRG